MNPFDQFRDLLAADTAQMAKLDAESERIRKSRERLNRAEARLRIKREAVVRPSWVRDLAVPLARQVAELTGHKGVTTAGPFGLGSRLSVYLTPEEVEYFYPVPDGTLHFTIEPKGVFSERDGNPMLSIVDHSVNTGRYSPNSIGELNGFNYLTKPIPDDVSPADLLKLIQECDYAKEVREPETA